MTDKASIDGRIPVVCDKCGETIACAPRSLPYGTIEAKIYWKTGLGYPEWAWRIPDLCRDCMGKVKELLIKHGIIIQTAEK